MVRCLVPELNPDKLLNADLKRCVATAAPVHTKTALTRTASSALRNIQKQSERAQEYFQRKDVNDAGWVLSLWTDQ